ncbi:MAG: membrane protein insertase YidC, partial [Clostridia bacterium]|nr:membrane protein insertase YidC [Clostridia bacterium]
MDLFEIISVPFGYVFKALNGLTGSYLFSIILFSIILKLVLFPFSIKQQKNSQKQAALRPKENIIRKKYAGRTDRSTMLKMNTEIQEMYQKENYNPMGGCLPMILQMLVLLAVYGV